MTISIALLCLSSILGLLVMQRQNYELQAQTTNGIQLPSKRKTTLARDNIYFEMEGGGGYGYGGYGSGLGPSCGCGGNHSTHGCNCGCHHSSVGYGSAYGGPYVGTHTSSDVCPWCGHVGRSPTGPYIESKQQEPAGAQMRYGFFERLLAFFDHWFG